MRKLAALVAVAALALTSSGATAATHDIALPSPDTGWWEVSPDGRWIASAVGTQLPDGQIRTDVYAQPVDGGPPRLLGSADAGIFRLAWQPDGKGLAGMVLRGANMADVEIIALPLSGGVVSIESFAASECDFGTYYLCAGPLLLGSTPQGIVYTRLRGGVLSVVRAGLGGRGPSQLLAAIPIPLDGEPWLRPTPSCSLTSVGWAVCLVGGRRLLRVATAGPPRADLLLESDGDINPDIVLSRDGGAALAFERPSGSPDVNLYAVQVRDRGGAALLYRYAAVAPAPTPPTNAIVSPDERLAIFAESPGSDALMVAPLDGSAPARRLGGSAQLASIHYSSPAELARRYFTPDSRWMVFAGDCGAPPGLPAGHTLCRYDLLNPSAPPAPLALPPADLVTSIDLNFAIAADGRSAIYAQTTQGTQIYTIGIADPPGPAQLQIPDARVNLTSFLLNVLPVADGFFVVDHDAYVLVRHGAPPRQVDSLSSDQVLHSATPDGRAIYDVLTPGARLTRVADLGLLRGGFAAAALCASEPDGLARVPVELATAPADTRTLRYSVSGGSAGSADYTLPTSGTVSFAPGERLRTIDVRLAQDADADGGETLELSLSADPASVEIARARFTLTILDSGHCQSALPALVRP